MGDAMMQKKCRKCQINIAKYQCGRCKSKMYCSKECQQIHWKIHKQKCKESIANRGFSDVKIKSNDEEKNNDEYLIEEVDNENPYFNESGDIFDSLISSGKTVSSS